MLEAVLCGTPGGLCGVGRAQLDTATRAGYWPHSDHPGLWIRTWYLRWQYWDRPDEKWLRKSEQRYKWKLWV